MIFNRIAGLRALKFFSTMPTSALPNEREIFINAPWGKIAALTWGDSKNPPVILCHGKLDVSSGFRPLISLLPPSFFYVSVDLPGNGRSERFNPGVRFTVVDFVPTIEVIREHFQWKQFAYIGHSLGVIIGKYYNIAYPDVITRMVELDPVPAHETWATENFANWYHQFYAEFYSEGRFAKNNGGVETAPKYTYEKALSLMMNTRGLNESASKHILERALEPAGDGLYRFTYDQRGKEIPRLPITAENMKHLYTAVKTPTYGFLSGSLLELGVYDLVPFVMDEKLWPNGNYRYKIWQGGHDEHINNPECVAEDISKFLLEGTVGKAKL